jgi:putative sigma-54 modulation protein
VQVSISARHGQIGKATQDYIEDKAQRLLRYFDRLTSVRVTVDLQNEEPEVEFVVSAEHKQDFIARYRGADLLATVDQAVQKMEQQLRKYKEKLQDHRRTPPQGEADRRTRP